LELYSWGIASLTCDRVNLFSRSLESITGELQSRGHDKPVAVFDDSREIDTRDEKRRLTGEICRGQGVHSLYIGLEEKKTFLEILKESLPGEFNEAVYYFILGDPGVPYIKGPGGNRNAILSAFAGKRLVSIDDDIILNTRVLPGSSPDVTLTRDKPGLDIGFFPDIQTLENITIPYTDDVFKYFDIYTGAATETLAPGSEHGKIKASMSGFYGGRWSQRHFISLFSEGRLRDLGLKSSADYKKTRYNMLGLVQAPNVLISRHPLFLGDAIGIDATSIVPPFEPHVRGEDTIWSDLLQFCDKNCMIAAFPFALYHDHTEKQPFSKKDLKTAGADLGLNMILLFSAAAEKTQCPPGSDPLACFGRTLIEFSEFPHNRWIDMCRALWYGYVGNVTETLKGLLAEYGRKPGFWAKDVDAFLDRIRSASMDIESFIPRELHAAGSPQEAGRAHRRMLYNYGMLLTGWSRIWDEILKINSSGHGLLGENYNLL